jgi:hypothetical protein
MTSGPPSALSDEQLAEDAMGYVPISAPSAREDAGEMILTSSPLPHRFYSTVSRIRWAGKDVPATVRSVRAHFAARGTSEFNWWLSPSTTPADLRERLIDLGAVPEPQGERATAMVLDRPPVGSVPDGVRVEAVQTLEQFRQLQQILLDIDDTTPRERADALLADLPGRWAGYRSLARHGFIAFVDGEPVSAGQIAMLDSRRALLTGGATRSWARGRGCYRALVIERWRLMSALGMQSMVVQASDMSTPVLTALGFRATATLSVLADRASRGD